MSGSGDDNPFDQLRRHARNRVQNERSRGVESHAADESSTGHRREGVFQHRFGLGNDAEVRFPGAFEDAVETVNIDPDLGADQVPDRTDGVCGPASKIQTAASLAVILGGRSFRRLFARLGLLLGGTKPRFFELVVERTGVRLGIRCRSIRCTQRIAPFQIAVQAIGHDESSGLFSERRFQLVEELNKVRLVEMNFGTAIDAEIAFSGPERQQIGPTA